MQTETQPKPAQTGEIQTTKKALKSITGAMTSLFDSAHIHVQDGSATIKGVDPAHVSMMQATLKATGEITTGLDLANLKTYAGKCDGDVSLSIEAAKTTATDSLGVKRSFKNPEAYEPKVPALNLATVATIQQNDFLSVLKHCGDVSDHVEIKTSGDVFTVSAFGGDEESKVTKEFPGAATGQDSRTLYSLDYFEKIVKASDGALTLEFGTDFPLRASWAFEGVAFVALLAPRIESQ